MCCRARGLGAEGCGLEPGSGNAGWRWCHQPAATAQQRRQRLSAVRPPPQPPNQPPQPTTHLPHPQELEGRLYELTRGGTVSEEAVAGLQAQLAQKGETLRAALAELETANGHLERMSRSMGIKDDTIAHMQRWGGRGLRWGWGCSTRAARPGTWRPAPMAALQQQASTSQTSTQALATAPLPPQAGAHAGGAGARRRGASRGAARRAGHRAGGGGGAAGGGGRGRRRRQQ